MRSLAVIVAALAACHAPDDDVERVSNFEGYFMVGDKSALYASSLAGTVVEIDKDTRAARPLVSNTRGVLVGDGAGVYAFGTGFYGLSGIRRIDKQTGAVEVAVSDPVTGLAVDGETLFWSPGTPQLMRTGAPGSEVFIELPDDEVAHYLAVDEQSLYFCDDAPGCVAVDKQTGLDRRQLTAQGGATAQLALAGDSLYYVRHVPDASDQLWAVDIPGGEPRVVFEPPDRGDFIDGQFEALAVAPDGELYAATHDEIVRVTAGDSVELVTRREAGLRPGLHVDSTHVYFTELAGVMRIER